MSSEPLRLDVDLRCSAEHAFATWTARFGAWWPRGHSVSGNPASVVLEPGVGGRIYEVAPDGAELEWGRVTLWEPPRRLGYTWHLRRDPADATDVLLEFIAVGPDAARLEITHTGWDRLGDEAASWRDRNTRGWGGLLPVFARAAAGG